MCSIVLRVKCNVAARAFQIQSYALGCHDERCRALMQLQHAGARNALVMAAEAAVLLVDVCVCGRIQQPVTPYLGA